MAQLWTVAHDGTDPRKVWEATDQEPIYLAWSPNAALIAMLVQGDDDLELVLIDTTGGQQPRTIAKGNPFYYTWSSDSRSLLLHVGDTTSNATARPELGILRLGPPDEYRSLGIVPGNFRTPGWSADGRKIAFVANGPDGVPAVSLVSPEGGDITRVASAAGQIAFALTADGARLAWSSRTENDRLVYDGLEVVSTDGRRRARVTDESVVAFFWSPDAQRLAFVTLDRGSTTFAWNVADADGQNPKRLGTFTPTPDQLRTAGVLRPVRHLARALVAGRHRAGLRRRRVRAIRGSSAPAGRGTVMTVPADGAERAKTLISGNFVALPVPAP